MTINDYNYLMDLIVYLTCSFLMMHYALRLQGQKMLIAIIATACWQMSCTEPYDSKYKVGKNLETYVIERGKYD